MTSTVVDGSVGDESGRGGGGGGRTKERERGEEGLKLGFRQT